MPLHPFEFLEFLIPIPELWRLLTQREKTIVHRLFDADTSGLIHSECKDALREMLSAAPDCVGALWNPALPDPHYAVPVDKLNVLNHRLANVIFEEVELQQFMAVPKEARPELFQRLVLRVCGPRVQTSALPDDMAGLEAMALQAEARAAWPEDVRQYVEWMEAKLTAAEALSASGDGLELRVGEDFADFTQRARLILDGHRFMLSQTLKEDMPERADSLLRPRRKITLEFVEAGPV